MGSETSNPPYGVDLVGPLATAPRYVPVVDGFKVPYLEVRECLDGWEVICDGRHCIPHLKLEEVQRWLPFIANAMAVAAGYPCHGSREKMHPFGCRVSSIGADVVADSVRDTFHVVEGEDK